MTFKDLKFEPHKVIPKLGIQAKLEVKPKVFVSVIAGEGFYSSAKGTGIRGAVTSEKNVASFEVAIINKDGEFVDDVLGWQGREDIDNLIKKLS